jgi:site-specific DNA-methyltransferase (adenine-specific)
MQITNEDNMALMARYPDNYFDLAIVDPPYGIGASGKTYGKRKKKHIVKDWDNETPDEKYFEELFRVSRNQIIWGGNYFDLPLTNGWIIWDKDRQKETTFSDGEMGWTSFLSLLKITKLKYDGFLGMDSDGRIHPTQKPIKLYKWLLMNYAKSNDKILDTHLGSGSIAIACYDLGFHLTACELDTDYFNGALKRLENHKLQLKIF